MKIKTNALTDKALDCAVALALGSTASWFDTVGTWWVKLDGKDRALAKGWAQSFMPSTDWAHGGPLIEQEEIELQKWAIDGWCAEATSYQFFGTPQERAVFADGCGPHPLIAAMRCLVASKMGEEVEIPEGLI